MGKRKPGTAKSGRPKGAAPAADVYHVRLPEAQRQWMRKLDAANGVSEAETVRRCVAFAMRHFTQGVPADPSLFSVQEAK